MKLYNTITALILFGKARRSVLALLYGHANKSFYLRQIVREAGIGSGAIQRELALLFKAGIITRTLSGHQVYYQANAKCPIFEELKSVIIKTIGIVDILKAALESFSSRIHTAFIYGSFARGDENGNSDIDVMLIGDISFEEVVLVFQNAQTTLQREINPTVYALTEFREKVISGHHFLNTVMKGNKIFLSGEERELKRMVKK